MLTKNRITITMMGISFVATMQAGIAWATVGQFHFTSGKVKIIDSAGKERAAHKGSTIDEGETIITAPAASAQLKMIDGGIIAVRPDTQLRVDTYIFKGKEDGTEKGQVSLQHGGFRTITGAIGHINKNNYKVVTPSATIGIRGTDHEPIFIPPALPGQPSVANAGTYDKVNVGVAYIATPLGSVNIQPNQVGYAAPDAMPQILPVIPTIYKQAPTPIQAKEEKKEEESKENGDQGKTATKSAEEKKQSAAAAKSTEEKNNSTSTTEQKTAETAATAETSATTETAAAPVRTTAVVDPTTTTQPAATSVTVTAPAITTDPVLVVTATDTSGTTINTTTSTLTSSSGATVPLTEGVYAIQAQSAADAAALAAAAAQSAATTAAVDYTALLALSPTDTVPASNAIVTANTAISTADPLVTTATSLTPADATTATADATAAQETAINAASLTAAAQANLTANGSFADSTAEPANTAVQTANTAIQTANTTIQNASITVATQNTVLSGAQTAATTALSAANTDYVTATNQLNIATSQNTAITTAQSAVSSSLVTAAQTAAAAAQTAATAAAAAAAQAAILQAAGDFTGAQAQLTIAQQQLTIAQQQQAAAQSAYTTIYTQYTTAQTAQTAATTAVTSSITAANTAATSAATGQTQASAAQTAAALGASALTTADTELANVQSSYPIVTANAPIAAYNNPAVATPDRFIGTINTMLPASGGYIEAFDSYDVGQSNTNFVLDGSKNLIEIRHAGYEETPASTATPDLWVADADIKRSGGTAAETYMLADNSLYLGRWEGGTITVTNNATSDTYIHDLGLTSDHWAIMLAPPANYVQALLGTATYTKTYATSPTDSLGNVGVLNSASLSADFTNQLVSAGVNLSINNKTLNVQAPNMSINGVAFNANAYYPAVPGIGTATTCTGTGCTTTYYANVGGMFTGDAAASAGLSYSLWSGQLPGSVAPATDLIRGLVAFTTPTAPTVSGVGPVQAYAQTDVSFELAGSNSYYGMYYYWGWMSSLTDAANVAPSANPPSFTVTNEHDWQWGTSFGLQLPGATGAVNGTATSFATTGIEFGRWTNVPSITSFSNDIPFGPTTGYYSNNSRWAFAPEGYLDNPTTLATAPGGSVTGVFNYVLNGAPTPIDQNGVTGTLNSMSLTADFTTSTVTATLNASLGTNTWGAYTAPMNLYTWNGTTPGFDGSLTVTNTTDPTGHGASGYLNGAFTEQNYAGAIVGYSIYDYLVADNTEVTSLGGVAALTRNGVGGNATVTDGTPNPTGKYVVFETGPYNSGFEQMADAVTTSAGVLTGYSTTYDDGSSNSTTVACTSCTGQAASDLATGIQFGTWDMGTRSYTNTSTFGGQIDWIKGPGLDPIYLPEALLGTMSYALDGGTAPTNQNGMTGTLTSASLGLNFTTQTVNIALGLSGVNGHSWSVSSVGTLLDWTDYSKNSFWASSALGAEVLPPGYLTVMMDGTTPANGFISGQLTGSGLNGALFQYQLNASLPMPVVPTTFIATDSITGQASSVYADPSGLMTFASDSTGMLHPITPFILNVATDGMGNPLSATASDGTTTMTVPTLTLNPSTPSYVGTVSETGEFIEVQTFGHLVTNTNVYGGLQYSNFGQWFVRPADDSFGPFTAGTFAGGMLPTATMPTNNATINGEYYGAMSGISQSPSDNNIWYYLSGSVNLAANFSTGALTGKLNNIWVTNTADGSGVGHFNDLALATTISANGFSGTVTAEAAPVVGTDSPINVPIGTTGTTSGHFYGPYANELTGIWGVSSGLINVAGSFGAANGTSDLPPIESVNGTVALVAATPADVTTPYRLVALSAYDPTAAAYTYENGMTTEGTFNNASRVLESAGHVTQFDSSYGEHTIDYKPSVTLSSGTAILTGAGNDPTTGISWGRWEGGTINITDRTTGVASSASLSTSSLHWIAGPTMTAPVALPTTGTYNYTLAGGTNPTDNFGNVGVLNSATLQADFAAQTVNVGVNVGISNALGATTLSASGSNIPIQQRTMFDAHTNTALGSLTASCVGAGCAGASPQAEISGAFTGATGAGAGMIYGFVNGTNVVSGVAAFRR